MKPILYKAGTVDFNSNGLGRLSECLSSVTTEIGNSLYENETFYPANGRLAKEITYNNLLLVKPNDKDENHVFEIYDFKLDTIDNTITIYSQTITNQLGVNLVKRVKITDMAPQQAMNMMKSNLVEPTRFDFVSDITTTSSTEWINRNPLNCIAGEEGSLLHYWGGEIKRDNRTIYLYKRRGNDKVAIIREGKHIKGLSIQHSLKGLVTMIVPFRTYTPEGDNKEEVTEYGTNVLSPLADRYPHKYIKEVDYSQDETVTDLITLNKKAAQYFTEHNGIDKPNVTVELEMEDLSQSAEFERFKKFETIGLFDTILVYSKKYDVQVEAKIMKIEYDSLNEKNIRVEAGSFRTGLMESITSEYKDLTHKREEVLRNIIQISANGKNRNFRGPDEPTTGMVKNDLWYQPVGEGEIMLHRFDGATWQLEKVSAGLLGGVLDADVENGDVDLINVNVSTIVGDISEFIESYWNKINSQVKVDGEALTITNLSENQSTIFKDAQIIFRMANSFHYWKATKEGIALLPGSGNVGNDNNAGLSLLSTYYNYLDFGYGSDGGYGVRMAKRDDWWEVLSKNGGDFRLVHGPDPATDRKWLFQDGKYGSFSFGKTRLTFNGEDDSTYPRVSVLNANTNEYAFISAASFDISSERELKDNIRPLEGALGILSRVNVYQYTKNEQEEVGIITDEAPEQLLTDGGTKVSIYSYVATLHQAVKELSETVAQQEMKMDKLTRLLTEKGVI